MPVNFPQRSIAWGLPAKRSRISWSPLKIRLKGCYWKGHSVYTCSPGDKTSVNPARLADLQRKPHRIGVLGTLSESRGNCILAAKTHTQWGLQGLATTNQRAHSLCLVAQSNEFGMAGHCFSLTHTQHQFLNDNLVVKIMKEQSSDVTLSLC